MNRAILESCLPCLVALVMSFILLRIVVRFSGARLNLRQLRRLHHCEQGTVQSLSMVLTLPLFIMIVMFIVQVSQLMNGLIVVHYAAFATARAASVWIPARVEASSAEEHDRFENVLTPAYASSVWPESVRLRNPSNNSPIESNPQFFRLTSGRGHYLKHSKLLTAAALACAPIAPSRDLGFQGVAAESDASRVIEAAKVVYQNLDPNSESNTRIPRRIENKIAYALANTEVRIVFKEEDTDRREYPTYNPNRYVQIVTEGGTRFTRVWNPNEVEWQNGIEVIIAHNFALLPGPGRFLAKYLVRADGQVDRTANRIETTNAPNGDPLYTTRITATATLTHEGVKSVLPYEQTR